MTAAESGSHNAVNFLIKQGADINETNADNKTCKDLAQEGLENCKNSNNNEEANDFLEIISSLDQADTKNNIKRPFSETQKRQTPDRQHDRISKNCQSFVYPKHTASLCAVSTVALAIALIAIECAKILTKDKKTAHFTYDKITQFLFAIAIGIVCTLLLSGILEIATNLKSSKESSQISDKIQECEISEDLRAKNEQQI